MTTTELPGNDTTSSQRRCGCCGRTMPTDRLTELGTTPGVYICAGCAVWAARRASRLPDLHRLTHAIGHLARWRPGHRHGNAGTVNSAIPILTSGDLERTITFWQHLGFDVAVHGDGYLVMHAHGVEVHFSRERATTAGTSPAQAFIHVQDVAALFKRLKNEDVAGLEPLQDQDYGLREFVITDPDGNRIRIGSPLD